MTDAVQMTSPKVYSLIKTLACWVINCIFIQGVSCTGSIFFNIDDKWIKAPQLVKINHLLPTIPRVDFNHGEGVISHLIFNLFTWPWHWQQVCAWCGSALYQMTLNMDTISTVTEYDHWPFYFCIAIILFYLLFIKSTGGTYCFLVRFRRRLRRRRSANVFQLSGKTPEGNFFKPPMVDLWVWEFVFAPISVTLGQGH